MYKDKVKNADVIFEWMCYQSLFMTKYIFYFNNTQFQPACFFNNYSFDPAYGRLNYMAGFVLSFMLLQITYMVTKLE